MSRDDNYYAFDDCRVEEVTQSVMDAIRSAEPSLSWFALFDRAFDFERSPLELKTESASLYSAGRLQGLSELAPTLVSMPTRNEHALSRDLRRLIAHSSGRPMLSFVSSELPLRHLATRLQDVLEVATADGQKFVLRLADTRTIEGIGGALSAVIQTRITRGLSHWLVIDRWGKLADSRLTVIPGAEGPVILSDQEFAKLLELNKPDAIAQQLSENFPEVIPTGRGAQFHALLTEACEFGSAHGLNGFPEFTVLALAAASTQGRILKLPQFASWIQSRHWASDDFEEGVAAYMDEAA